MGEAARRKAMGPRSNPNESVDRGPWLHGTNVRFDSWQVPPPLEANDPFNVPHTAVFLTKHAEFAQDAGSFTCEAMLTPDARVLVPESDESGHAPKAATKASGRRSLRMALRRGHLARQLGQRGHHALRGRGKACPRNRLTYD